VNVSKIKYKASIDFFFFNIFKLKEFRETAKEIPDLKDIS